MESLEGLTGLISCFLFVGSLIFILKGALNKTYIVQNIEVWRDFAQENQFTFKKSLFVKIRFG